MHAKPIPLPLPPAPVELEPVASHRIEFHIGDSHGTFELTGSIVHEKAAPRNKKPAIPVELKPRVTARQVSRPARR